MALDAKWWVIIAIIAVIIIAIIAIIYFYSGNKQVTVVSGPPVPDTIPPVQTVDSQPTTPTSPPTPCDYNFIQGVRAGGGRLVAEPAIECNDDPACLGYDTERGYIFSSGDFYYDPDWDKKGAGTYIKKSPGCRWAQIPNVPFTPECGYVKYDSKGIVGSTIEEMPASDLNAVRARCNELSNCIGYVVPGGGKAQLKALSSVGDAASATASAVGNIVSTLEDIIGYSFVKSSGVAGVGACIGGTSQAGAASTSTPVSASTSTCDFMNVDSLEGQPIAMTNSLLAAKLLCSQSDACGGIMQRDSLYVLYPLQANAVENKLSTASILAKRTACAIPPLVKLPAAGPPPAQYVFVPQEVPAATSTKSIARIDARGACDADPTCTGYTYDSTLTSTLFNTPLTERSFKIAMAATEGTYLKVMDPLPTCGYTVHSGEVVGQTIGSVTSDPRGACTANPACMAYSTYFDNRQNAYTVMRLKSGTGPFDTTIVKSYVKNNAACAV